MLAVPGAHLGGGDVGPSAPVPHGELGGCAAPLGQAGPHWQREPSREEERF